MSPISDAQSQMLRLINAIGAYNLTKRERRSITFKRLGQMGLHGKDGLTPKGRKALQDWHRRDQAKKARQ